MRAEPLMVLRLMSSSRSFGIPSFVFCFFNIFGESEVGFGIVERWLSQVFIVWFLWKLSL